jgi:phosphate transport system permease protein
LSATTSRRDGVAAAGTSPSLRRSRPRYGERLIVGLLFASAFLSVAVTAGIVVSLAIPTWEFLREVNIGRFLTGTNWAPLFDPPEFGVLPLVTATLTVTAVAMLVAVPAGLGAAAYLSEYSSRRFRKIFKPVLEVLAGIPTVVYGFFALTFVTPLLQDIWPFGHAPDIYNMLAPGLVMGVMILPTVASLSEDAMSAVPQSLRAGAFALGSTKRQTTVRVVFPAALSGIVSAGVLGVSRAIGETMIVLVAAGGTPRLTFDPRQGAETMTAFIAAAGFGDQPSGTTGYKTIFAVGALLFIGTFIMNIFSIRLVRRFREVYE